MQLTDEAEEACYLSEDYWKKIDELADFLKKLVDFKMDNKFVSAIERFVGIYMAGGGTESEAADAVIATMILPESLAAIAEKEEGNSAALVQFMDSHFGLTSFPLCQQFLKKYAVA